MKYTNIIYGKHSTKQNFSKTSVRWPMSLHARRAVQAHHWGCGMGLTKPAAFLSLPSPGHRKEVQRKSAGRPQLHSQPIYRVPLQYKTTDGSPLVVFSFHRFSYCTVLPSSKIKILRRFFAANWCSRGLTRSAWQSTT